MFKENTKRTRFNHRQLLHNKIKCSDLTVWTCRGAMRETRGVWNLDWDLRSAGGEQLVATDLDVVGIWW